MVLDVDPQKRRISLGLKQTLANPWEAFLEEHPAGSEIEGEVRNITEFGLFVGLPGDIDGMVHLTDIDWNRSGEEAINNYRRSEVVRVKVLDVDVEKERISLGIKQLADDPFEAGMAKLKKGEVLTGTVSAITDGGVEVTIGDGVPGFIRKSELSRDRSVRWRNSALPIRAPASATSWVLRSIAHDGKARPRRRPKRRAEPAGPDRQQAPAHRPLLDGCREVWHA
jgi:small subunit ribosomal protein S1